MVFYYKTISDYPDATGIMPLLFSIRDAIPLAFPLLLLVVWFVLIAGNFFFVSGKTGRQKLFTASVASSFVLVILSLFLAMATLVSWKIVLLWTFMSIISFIGMLLSDKQ